MSRHIRIVMILGWAFSLSVYFVNCAGGLPDEAQSGATKGSSNSKPLSVGIVPAQITVGGTAQAIATGGLPPYTYKISSGSASVGVTGQITLATIGGVVVEVKDSQGHTGYAALSVIAATTVVEPATPCTTAFGTTIPSGGTVTGFAAALVNCPATCATVTATCTNGTLSTPVAANSCSVNSCVYKLISANSCPSGFSSTVPGVPSSCSAGEIGQGICYYSFAPPIFGGTPQAYGQYQCSSP